MIIERTRIAESPKKVSQSVSQLKGEGNMQGHFCLSCSGRGRGVREQNQAKHGVHLMHFIHFILFQRSTPYWVYIYSTVHI